MIRTSQQARWHERWRRRPLSVAAAVAAPVLLTTFALVGWQVFVWLSDIRPQVLPGPIRIIRESIEDAETIGAHALVTMSEVGAGFAISITFALALGLVDRPVADAAARGVPADRRVGRPCRFRSLRR